jgi:hypothetical protein
VAVSAVAEKLAQIVERIDAQPEGKVMPRVEHADPLWVAQEAQSRHEMVP